MTQTPTPEEEFAPLVALAAGEVITHALPNDVRLADGRTLVLVTLDNGVERPNTFGPRGLLELRGVLAEVARRAAAGEVAAVAVTGKPAMFAAGADVTAPIPPDDAAAALLPRLGHETFSMLHSCGVPSFAFIGGVALGGGLEVALNADYRTVSLAALGIGFPETSLGLVPGWGGSWLLPNLVGIETALRVIVGDALRNRTLQGPEALRLGIADAGFGAARFLEESIAWAGRVTAGTLRVRRPHRPGRLGRAVTWDAAVGVARRELTRSIGPVPKAPYEALELVKAAKSGSREAGFAREDAVLARLIRSEQFRASRYAFSLLHGRARRPAGVADPAAARPITKLGIVGAGLMASQIAALALYRLQVPVVVSDVDEEHVAAGLARIRATLAGLRERGRLDDDRLQRLVQAVTGTVDPAGFVGCDWVTEAVFEDLEAKRTALSRVEAYLDDEAILATNTSSLSVTQIAACLARPERLVGFHFFNPVSRMPLVEVVPGAATSQAAVATAAALAGALRKTVIVTRDTTGFVVNRVLARFLSEVLGAVGSGTPLERVDRALQPIGLPMAPSMLLELVGLPVAAHVLAVHHEAFPARYQASERLARLAEHGRLYGRDDKGRPTTLDAKAAASLQGRGRARRPERILGDVQLALADEIHRMLEDRVVDAVEDIDLGLLLGAGWPMHTGGVTPYLDRVGASRRAFGGLFHDVGPGLPV